MLYIYIYTYNLVQARTVINQHCLSACISVHGLLQGWLVHSPRWVLCYLVGPRSKIPRFGRPRTWILDHYIRYVGSRDTFLTVSSNVLEQCVALYFPHWLNSQGHSPRLNPAIQWLKTQASAQTPSVTTRHRSHHNSTVTSPELAAQTSGWPRMR